MRSLLRRTRVRLTLVVGAVFLVLAGIAAVGIVILFSRLEYQAIDRSLSDQAQSLLSSVDNNNGAISVHGGDPLPGETAEGIAIGAVLLDSGGHVLDSTGTAPSPTVVASLARDAAAQGSAAPANVSQGGRTLRALATPLSTGGNGGSRAVLVVTRPVDELLATRLQLAVLLAAAVALLTVIVAVLAYRLTGLAMRPVRAMAATARELGEHDLHHRIALDLPDDELGELAATFNGMLARLETAFATLERFTADAAHELRAPLMLLRTELEVSLSRTRTAEEYAQSQRTALEEVERLSRLADQLLTLARVDAGELSLQRQPVDLADLVDETVERWRPLAAGHSVALRSRVTDEGTLGADPLLLRRVLDNLVDNAVRHTPEGGSVVVGVAADDQGFDLTVADTGPGVPQPARATLFERFTRGDASRGRTTGGAGLGLALCRAITELHGGSIALDDSMSGAVVRVRLPRRDLRRQSHRAGRGAVR